MKDEEQRVYIFDTNVLKVDPKALDKYKTHIRVIPITVIEELDNMKYDFSVREVVRELKRIANGGCLTDGVKLDDGGELHVSFPTKEDLDDIPLGFYKKNDNLILAIAKKWKKLAPDKEVVLVTNDNVLLIKSNSLGVVAEEYESGKAVGSLEQLYSGYVKITLEDRDLLDQIYKDGYLDANLVNTDYKLIPNQCCELILDNLSVLTIYKRSSNRLVLLTRYQRSKNKNTSIYPLDTEQEFAYALLTDPNIDLISMSGKAGTGKTLMSLKAGIDMLNQGLYNQIIVYRPIVEIGEKLGSLPGDVDEKIDPWKDVIRDNLELLVDDVRIMNFSKNMRAMQKVDELLKSGLVKISVINFVQGRTLNNKYIIVDEAQYYEPPQTRMLVTRPGDVGGKSKMVLTGDLKQRINKGEFVSNGLSHVIEKMKHFDIAGHITLVNCNKRSELAEIAANVL